MVENRRITIDGRRMLGTGLLAAATLLAGADRPTTPVPALLYHRYDAGQTQQIEQQTRPTAENPKIVFLAKKHHEHGKVPHRHEYPKRRDEHAYPTTKDVRAYVKWRTVKEFGNSQWQYVNDIINFESRWEPDVVNPDSGACGLFQADPCSKMRSMKLGDQVDFGLGYIKAVYTTPERAWDNELTAGWY